MHIQFDNAGSEYPDGFRQVCVNTLSETQIDPREYLAGDTLKFKAIKPTGPGFGSVDFPLSERIQSAIKEWGICDAARYYARHGIKIAEFLILAGPVIRSGRSI